jgi:hypothetical protein
MRAHVHKIRTHLVRRYLRGTIGTQHNGRIPNAHYFIAIVTRTAISIEPRYHI